MSGTVYGPNGTLPLYNAIVYVPSTPLDPIKQGITCDHCGALASGNPLVTTLSDSTGKFVLTGVPAGTNIPLVIQLGKWRRQTTIPKVTACEDTALTDPNLTRLPRNQQEGSMPHIALTTGGCDSIGCMLPKVGIDAAEFGVQKDGYSKAIHVYSSGGDAEGTNDPDSGLGVSDGLTNTTSASTLWGDPTLLRTYDMGIFSCECDESLTTKGASPSQVANGEAASLPVSPDFANVTDYLNSGGRIFTTDYQYTWYRYSPDPNIGATAAAALSNTGLGIIPGGAPDGLNPLTLNTSFPKGLALSQWLQAIFGPLTNGVTCDSVYDNITSLSSAPQTWATADGLPHVFTVDTPVGLPAAQQCGKGVHIDAHITVTKQGSADFVGCNNDSSGKPAPGPVGSAACYPSTCTGKLKEDEAMFAFFFFDLASCIQNEGAPPQPPPPTPH